LTRDPGGDATRFKVGQYRPSLIEKVLSDPENKYHKALVAVADGRGLSGRAPIQWGALGDPFDRIERHQGWALKVLPLFDKYNQAVRISTKGGDLVQMPEYQRAFGARPEVYWVAWSIITIDDDILSKIDKDAPSAEERLKGMAVLSRLGVKNSLRLRPMLPGVSDVTPAFPHAWRDLLRRGRDAGAQAVSCEFTFVPGAMPPHIRRMWREIERISGVPVVQFFKDTSIQGACLRSSRAWKEDLTYAIYEEAKRLGYAFGISDPHFKELNDYGCCCGIAEDDPVFGGWQRQQATNALVVAKRNYDAGKPDLVMLEDIVPPWASGVRVPEMIAMTGPANAYRRETWTWADKLRETWNDVRGARGPLHYFEGVLMPYDRDNTGNVRYEYVPYERRRRITLKSPRLRMSE
jgi:DNA repair photolyase